MVHAALKFLSQEVNNYLKLRNGITSNKLVLTNVATEDGGWAIPDNHLGMSVINIEEERVMKEQQTRVVNTGGETHYRNPEIKLNLYLIITANYTHQAEDTESTEYIEGLKQLSYIISFFQQRNVFTPANSPAMATVDPNLEKLVIELFSYSFEQLYNFWSVVGAKYLPSVLYRVRLVTVQEDLPEFTAPAITEINLDAARS